MSALKFGNVALCEHVVPSGKGKYTLINVFAGDVIVPSFPAMVTFGFYAEVVPDANGPMDLALKLKTDQKVIGRIDGELEDSKPGLPTPPVIPLATPEFEKECTFSLVAESKSYRSKTILKKKILKLENQDSSAMALI